MARRKLSNRYYQQNIPLPTERIPYNAKVPVHVHKMLEQLVLWNACKNKSEAGTMLMNIGMLEFIKTLSMWLPYSTPDQLVHGNKIINSDNIKQMKDKFIHEGSYFTQEILKWIDKTYRPQEKYNAKKWGF